MANVSAKKHLHKPSGILLDDGDHLYVFGGTKLGFTTTPDVHVELSYGRPSLRKPCVAVTINFKRPEQSHSAFFDTRGLVSNSYSISLKFMPRLFKASARPLTENDLGRLQGKPAGKQFAVLELTATDGQPEIEGIGLPFADAEDGTTSRTLNFLKGSESFVGMSLLSLCQQTSISVLVTDMALIKVAESRFNYYVPDEVPRPVFPYTNG
jgi:hypothetical protein